MLKTSTPILFRVAIIAILLTLGSLVHAQTVGVRPGIGFYTDAVGFEGLLEGRFDLPFFEEGPGQITASAFLGYSYVSVDEASKSGVMLGAGTGYEFRFDPDAIYFKPGLIVGAEFSEFQDVAVESNAAVMLFPYVEGGYEFDFNLSVGLQAGLKNLIYTGEGGAAERSISLGPVVHYTFGE